MNYHKNSLKKSVVCTNFVKYFGNIKFYGLKSAVILCKFQSRILSEFKNAVNTNGILLPFGCEGRRASAAVILCCGKVTVIALLLLKRKAPCHFCFGVGFATDKTKEQNNFKKEKIETC